MTAGEAQIHLSYWDGQVMPYGLCVLFWGRRSTEMEGMESTVHPCPKAAAVPALTHGASTEELIPQQDAKATRPRVPPVCADGK